MPVGVKVTVVIRHNQKLENFLSLPESVNSARRMPVGGIAALNQRANRDSVSHRHRRIRVDGPVTTAYV